VQRLCGTDGNAKMSKSLGNVINLSSPTEEVKKQIRSMYTDPNRVRATDPGKVEGNPVFIYHDIFNKNKDEVVDLKSRYLTGKVGDVEVKDKLFIAIEDFLGPIRERRAEIDVKSDKELLSDLLESTKLVERVARETMVEVREAMKIDY
jgi:tryptophanyl-tRNA synthetase